MIENVFGQRRRSETRRSAPGNVSDGPTSADALGAKSQQQIACLSAMKASKHSDQEMRSRKRGPRLLGLSIATLRAWRHRGKGPRFVRFGEPFGICPRTWTSSFAQAQLTRDRFLRQIGSRTRGVASMSLWQRGRQYWTDFTVAGRR